MTPLHRSEQRRPARQPEQRRRAAAGEASALARIAGWPAVAALFAAAPERVARLFYEARMKQLVGPFCAELAREHKPYRLVTVAELDRIAGTVLHGGIVALAEKRPVLAFDAAPARAWAADRRPLLLLDGVGNPHNLGAIARSAAFFGLPRIVLSDHPAQAGPSDAAYRVAEGGLEYIELYRAAPFAAALKALRGVYRVIAAAPGNHFPLAALRATDKPYALVLGNEEKGLPEATLAACEEIVTIPGAGHIQSLNVAASAAILLYLLTQSDRGRTRPG